MKVSLKICPPIREDALDALFASAWPNHRRRNWRPILRQALVYICAFEGKRLIGFAKVIGDGGVHGFLLDPTVAPDRQRCGIGHKLVEKCAREAKRCGVEWLHVDYELRHAPFYRACGFKPSKAGLRNLKERK